MRGAFQATRLVLLARPIRRTRSTAHADASRRIGRMRAHMAPQGRLLKGFHETLEECVRLSHRADITTRLEVAYGCSCNTRLFLGTCGGRYRRDRKHHIGSSYHVLHMSLADCSNAKIILQKHDFVYSSADYDSNLPWPKCPHAASSANRGVRSPSCSIIPCGERSYPFTSISTPSTTAVACTGSRTPIAYARYT